MAVDLLMKFVKGGDAIEAECQTSVDPRDRFLADFQAGRFFEIAEFSFGAGLDDDETGGRSLHGRFGQWLSGERSKAYPVDLEPVSFTRQMDKASPLLFEMCCNSQSFASATLVKRKAAGSDASGQAFLRIDFKDVLVIGVDWDSGDLVTERCRFICRGVKVQYKPQLANGTLGGAVPGTWNRMLARQGG